MPPNLFKSNSTRRIAIGLSAVVLLGLALMVRVSSLDERPPAASVRANDPGHTAAARAGASEERELEGKAEAAGAGQAASAPARSEADALLDFERQVLDTSQVLLNRVHRVLQAGDGERALALASTLMICQSTGSLLDAAYAELATPKQGRSHQVTDRQALAFAQNISGQCQTLGDQAQGLRVDLLKLATEKGVLGAAGKLLVQQALLGRMPIDTALAQQVVRDAFAGDASSAGLIVRAGVVPASPLEQAILGRALSLASADEENREWIEVTMIRQQSSAPLAAAFTAAESAQIEARAQLVAAALKRYELDRLHRFTRLRS